MHGPRRATLDIIWSWIVLNFSCGWIAIRPNMPSPDEPLPNVTLRRAGFMLLCIDYSGDCYDVRNAAMG